MHIIYYLNMLMHILRNISNDHKVLKQTLFLYPYKLYSTLLLQVEGVVEEEVVGKEVIMVMVMVIVKLINNLKHHLFNLICLWFFVNIHDFMFFIIESRELKFILKAFKFIILMEINVIQIEYYHIQQFYLINLHNLNH